MGHLTSYPRIITDETMKEVASHGSAEFPFGYYLEDIWQFDFHCVDWHWHPEVEFIYVWEGSVELLAGCNQYELPAGTGAFINSQVIHSFRAAGHAIMPNFVFSPELIAPEDSLIYRKYIHPVLCAGVDCRVFSAHDPQEKAILDILLEVIDLQEQAEPNPLRTVRLLMSLWDVVSSQMLPEGAWSAADSGVRTQAQLQRMMQYIHTNYSRKITLNDLAAVVSISKSSAMNLFRQYLHTSPINYLIGYRLKRAAKLLSTTRDSVSTVAEKTGFENVGYFCRKFKEAFHQTPSQYRRSASLRQ